MNNAKIIALLLASISVFITGCNSKDNIVDTSSNIEFSISDFSDFKYIMFFDSDTERYVIRDENGNEYIKSDDGYYYDDNGNRIKNYGAGDEKTAINGVSLGVSTSGSSSNYNKTINKDNNSGQSDKKQSHEEIVEKLDNGADGNIVIDDWESYKEQYMIDNGIQATEASKWYDDKVNDELNDYSPINDNKIKSNKSYSTVIDVLGGVPGSISFDTVQIGNNSAINGSITVDAEMFNDYMKQNYGSSYTDENGNNINSDYKDYLKEQSIVIMLYVNNDTYTDPRYYNSGELHFNDDYTLSFSIDGEVPDGYSAFIYINGKPYSV